MNTRVVGIPQRGNSCRGASRFLNPSSLFQVSIWQRAHRFENWRKILIPLTLTIAFTWVNQICPSCFQPSSDSSAFLLARRPTLTPQCFTKLLSTPIGSEAKTNKYPSDLRMLYGYGPDKKKKKVPQLQRLC